ncbi:MAG: glycosyltransferase family 1 protein [bacterium]|nr:glycosyltransferase family 1 protein [bacterium]
MKIAILGTRGVPASYGGFETFAEELGVRLVERGHEVTVYCRSTHYTERPATHRGIRLVWLPSIHTKYTDSISHTFLASVHATWEGTDIAYYCSAGNSTFTFLPRLRGTKVFINTDGLEWERAKWNRLGKLYFHLSEFLASKVPNVVVADSHVIQEYYKRKFHRDTEFVAYGSDIVERGTGRELLADLGVEAERYFLFVSRLEPENNAHLVVKAFEQVKTDMPLLIVGSAPFAGDYIRDLQSTSDPRIAFPGALYGDVYAALRANAFAYVNAMEVGGTHPAILEAMGAGNCVLVSDIPYNIETVGDAGLTFRNKDVDDLRDRIQHLVDHPDEVACYRTEAVERIKAHYNWNAIAETYESLFRETLGR